MSILSLNYLNPVLGYELICSEFTNYYNCFCNENEFFIGKQLNSDDHLLLIEFMKNNNNITFYLDSNNYKYLSIINDIAILLNKSYKICSRNILTN